MGCVHVLGRGCDLVGSSAAFRCRHGSFLALDIFRLKEKCSFELWPGFCMVDGSFSSGRNCRPMDRNQACSYFSNIVKLCSSILPVKPKKGGPLVD